MSAIAIPARPDESQPERFAGWRRPRTLEPAIRPARAAPAAPGRWPDHHAAWKVFVLSFALNLAAALLLTYVWRIGNADSLARTANAWYVLYSRDPHLAIGFVWPVLPSLAQVPLVPLFYALGHTEMAGFVMSAAAGAGVLAALTHLLGVFGVSGWTRLLWIFLLQLHPQFWFLSAIGLAETPFLLCITLAFLALAQARRSLVALVAIGLSLATAFFVRYEFLAFIGASAVAVLIQFVRWPGSLRLPALRREWEAIEGRLLVVLAPPLYVIAFWMLTNWMIMGDPLYFQRSLFSLVAAPDVARNVGPSHPLWTAIHNLPVTAGFALKRILQVQFALPLLAAAAAGLAVWRRDRRLLSLVVLTTSIYAFTSYQVFAGSLPGYLRYWASAAPFAVVLAGGCASALPAAPSIWRRLFGPGVALLLLGGIFVNAVQLGDSTGGLDEQRLAAELRGDSPSSQGATPSDFYWIRTADARALAAQLDTLSSGGLTLVDTETMFAALLHTKHPERLIITSDRDFFETLESPRGRVRYVVIAHPRVANERDLLNLRYPALYDGGVPWAVYRGEMQGIIQPRRIYELLPSDQSVELPPLAALEKSNSNLGEQMTTWQRQRSARRETPAGWLAFRQHVRAIGGPDPGDLGPDGFYNG